MLCELTKDGARTTLQMIKGEVFRDGVRLSSEIEGYREAAVFSSAEDFDCKSNTATFHKLYIDLKCNGWRELQVYL